MGETCEDSDFITGTCEWCGSANTAIFRDNNLCEECDTDTVHCAVCDERQHYHYPCRHVFRDRNFEWCGSGAGEPHAGQAQRIKGALFRLLEAMPAGFAPDLRTAIRSGKFHTWMVAPLIGGGGLLEMHGMPDRDGRSMFHAWGDALIEIGEGEHAEDTEDAYHWLASLYDRRTPAANLLTVRWIDEFMARHGTGQREEDRDG